MDVHLLTLSDLHKQESHVSCLRGPLWTSSFLSPVFTRYEARVSRDQRHMLAVTSGHRQPISTPSLSTLLPPSGLWKPNAFALFAKQSGRGELRRLGPHLFAWKGFGSPRKQQKPKALVPVWETDSKQCPCGSGRTYEACCQAYHLAEKTPLEAEALMRARFSAYVKKDANFLENTTHPDNPRALGSTTPDGMHSSTYREDCAATFRTIAWQQLRVLSTEAGSHEDEQYVTFQASFRVVNQKGQRPKGGVLQTLHERSRFLREDGQWLYIEGEEDVTAEPK